MKETSASLDEDLVLVHTAPASISYQLKIEINISPPAFLPHLKN
jgi:hypothetical protein